MAPIYQRIIFPLLKRMDAEQVHERTLSLLELANRFSPTRKILPFIAGPLPSKPVQAFGLTFPNVLGIAAGFDKDVRVAGGLAMLGFGHIEVGTLTPRPQSGNPKPRIFRLPADEAIINRMGFPNRGVEAAVPRLSALSRQKREFVLGVSIGKQKETPLGDAIVDYVAVMKAVYRFADYLAINVSSPNTPGLRQLQGGNYLNELLQTLQVENQKLAATHGADVRPLLVKIAPDLTWTELDAILMAVQENGISGIIATNTTLSREGLKSAARNEQGGLSGTPLRQRSTEIIAHITRQSGGRLPIIGAGGVRSAADVQSKLDAGASLVQLYTGLIYEGPKMAGHILRQL